jgi:hypothetical protein
VKRLKRLGLIRRFKQGWVKIFFATMAADLFFIPKLIGKVLLRLAAKRARPFHDPDLASLAVGAGANDGPFSGSSWQIIVFRHEWTP